MGFYTKFMSKRNSLALIGFIILALATYLLAVSMETHKKDFAEIKHEGHKVKIESERDFLEHMIPHHQEAVEAAQLVLEKGSTLRPVRELAEAIIEAQTKEIVLMNVWYQEWYSGPYEDTGVYTPMMRSLEELYGTELDRVFLEYMIVHHEMAIDLAKIVSKISISQETRALTESIVSSQQSEISKIKEVVKLLPL